MLSSGEDKSHLLDMALFSMVFFSLEKCLKNHRVNQPDFSGHGSGAGLQAD